MKSRSTGIIHLHFQDANSDELSLIKLNIINFNNQIDINKIHLDSYYPNM